MTYTLKTKLSAASPLDILQQLRMIVCDLENGIQANPEMLAGQTLDDDGRQLGAWVYRSDGGTN